MTVKKRNKLLLKMCILITCSVFSVCVHADPHQKSDNPDNTQYSTMWVNFEGGSTSETSMTTGNRIACYIRLGFIKFQYYPDNVFPSGTYMYASLYSLSNVKATNQASFSGVTLPGNYNIPYLSGFGGVGQSYRLRFSCNYTMTGYYVSFEWSANPFE